MILWSVNKTRETRVAPKGTTFTVVRAQKDLWGQITYIGSDHISPLGVRLLDLPKAGEFSPKWERLQN